MFICIAGNIVDGMTFYGAFDTPEDVDDFVNANGIFDWVGAGLETP